MTHFNVPFHTCFKGIFTTYEKTEFVYLAFAFSPLPYKFSVLLLEQSFHISVPSTLCRLGVQP